MVPLLKPLCHADQTGCGSAEFFYFSAGSVYCGSTDPMLSASQIDSGNTMENYGQSFYVSIFFVTLHHDHLSEHDCPGWLACGF
jgi:hypothetical protein